MKTKKLVFLLLISVAWCVFSFYPAKAQTGATKFRNGITVFFKTSLTNATANEKPKISTEQITTYTISNTLSDNSGIVHRVIADEKNGLYFGYDVKVAFHSEKGKFKVYVEPLSVKPESISSLRNVSNFATLPKYPGEMTISNGDTIALDLLEDMKTKVKLTDLINVSAGYEVAEQSGNRGSILATNISPTAPPRDFTLDDVELRLYNYYFFINDRVVVESGGGASGANLSFYVRDKGRFIFSLFPREGYKLQKVGVIENNQISFSFNGDTYRWVSGAPIVGTGGKWNLWVLYEPDYKPMRANPPYMTGAADKIEYFFNDKW